MFRVNKSVKAAIIKISHNSFVRAIVVLLICFSSCYIYRFIDNDLPSATTITLFNIAGIIFLFIIMLIMELAYKFVELLNKLLRKNK